MGKNKREHDIFRRKKTEKQNKTMMISVDGIGTVFWWRWNYQGNRLNKDIKKENFKKDLMNLIEANHQINVICDHSISRKPFEFKSFDMLLTQ